MFSLRLGQFLLTGISSHWIWLDHASCQRAVHPPCCRAAPILRARNEGGEGMPKQSADAANVI